MHYTAYANDNQKRSIELYSGKSKSKAESAIAEVKEIYDNLYIFVDYGYDKGMSISTIKGEFVPEKDRTRDGVKLFHPTLAKDIEGVQNAISNQAEKIGISGRFVCIQNELEPNVEIVDTISHKKIVVPLFAYREVRMALAAFF